MSVSGIISNIKSRITTGKPYILGGVIGAVAMAIVAFNAGWVVGAGTHANAITEARINAVATVCSVQARQHWMTEGNENASLEGWNNDVRDELAERFTPKMEEIRASKITRLCGKMLKPV